MTSSFYVFAIAALGVWRITHLVSVEDGPWQMFTHLRRAVEQHVRTEALNCFYCASVWIAFPMAWWIGGSVGERLLIWPALSALAIVLERTTVSQGSAGRYFEHPASQEGEQDHGLLRKE